MTQLSLCPKPTRKDPWRARWQVPSRSTEGTTYTVALAAHGRAWGCSCPQWIYFRRTCHHIRAVKEGHG